MPRLTILTACERVLIDRASSLPTLVNIFQRMNIQLQDAPLAENAVAASKWAIFALWVHTPEERDVEFTQRTEIIGPSGTKFAEAVTKFRTSDADDLQSKNHIDILGLPINAEGFIKVRVWLEGIADTTGEYQFAVKYLPKEQNEQSAVSAN
jgi:hypothetical protein